MDPASIGLFATAPWLAILVASRFVPALLHAVGPSASLALSALGSTAVIAAMAFTDDMAVFFVLNLLAGLGLIVRWVTCDTWIVTIAPVVGAEGRAIGTHETLMGLGHSARAAAAVADRHIGKAPVPGLRRADGAGPAAAARARALEPASRTGFMAVKPGRGADGASSVCCRSPCSAPSSPAMSKRHRSRCSRSKSPHPAMTPSSRPCSSPPSASVERCFRFRSAGWRTGSGRTKGTGCARR